MGAATAERKLAALFKFAKNNSSAIIFDGSRQTALTNVFSQAFQQPDPMLSAAIQGREVW